LFISADNILNDILAKISQRMPFEFDVRGVFHARSQQAQPVTAFAELLVEAVAEEQAAVEAEQYVYEPEPRNPIISSFSPVDNSVTVDTNVTNLGGLRGAVITQEIHDAIMVACAKYGVDINLVKGVIQAESWFNPNVTSRSGAQGLMQLMPGTARWLGVTDSYDINQNIDGGVNYLRQMLDMFDHDVSLALAGYNAGPNAVKRFGGIPPYEETINYVPRVLDFQHQYLQKLMELGT
jgi:soluble lytic murein transglycosylase-like protein